MALASNRDHDCCNDENQNHDSDTASHSNLTNLQIPFNIEPVSGLDSISKNLAFTGADNLLKTEIARKFIHLKAMISNAIRILMLLASKYVWIKALQDLLLSLPHPIHPAIDPHYFGSFSLSSCSLRWLGRLFTIVSLLSILSFIPIFSPLLCLLSLSLLL